VLIPASKAAQQRRQAARIRDFAKEGRSVPDAHSDRVAIPVRPTGIRIAARVQLDAALRIDEQPPVCPEKVQHYVLEMIHLSPPKPVAERPL
jgi:hypothetical protein